MTTTATSTGLPWIGLISAISIRAPMAGAMTTNISTSDTHTSMCQPCHSCQKMKAEIIATAPRPKLKMPVLV